MSPRSRLSLALLAALACACGEAERRPSVILISIDTLRADHLGTYGYERDTSPFLDRFARDAVVYEQAFTPAPWTLVAHMTMLTGLFPAQHGVVQEELALSPEIPLLAERLEAAGYQTLGLYYPCWIDERYGFARGFDVFRAHGSVEEARALVPAELARLDRARPYFLFLHLFDVHDGPLATGAHMLYASPPPYQDFFMPDAAGKLPALAPDVLWKSRGLLTSEQVAALVALYDGGIRHVDANLALLFGELERGGWLANTLVIVTADHGEALAQRGKLSGHGDMAQEGLHVPLIVRHPRGERAGTRVAEPVHLGDIVPTILALSALPADERLAGQSLFGPLATQRLITGTFLPEEYVVRWPEKWLRHKGLGCLGVDLERDPDELDFHPIDPKLFKRLQAEALGARVFPAPLQLAPMSSTERDALRALGYGGGDDDETGAQK
ncbi:MAG: sulfatase [Planctomycetes bacterium]|nr:sulfatase [Planctomycetota bacterium]